jgi:hypothetical protein
MHAKNSNSNGQAGIVNWNDNAWFKMALLGSTFGDVPTFGRANAGSVQLLGPTGGPILLGTFTANDIVLGTNNFERMTIHANGNVGIGTITPGSRLAVAGLPSGTTDAVVSGTLAGAVCITNEGNMYIDIDGLCGN